MFCKNSHLSILLLLFTTACSLEPKKNQSEVQIDLGDILKTTQSAYQESPFDFLNQDVGARTIPLPSMANFNCFGVNVTGPGIPNSGQGGPPPNAPPNYLAYIHQKLLTRQSYCAYRGIVSPPVSFASAMNVSMQVPSGPARVVQVVGSYSATQCANGFTGSGGAGSQLDIYEVGRAVVDLFGDVSLNINNEWPTGGTASDQSDRLGRVVDCEGCENFGISPPPSVNPSWTVGTFTGVAQKILLFNPGRIQRVHFRSNYSIAAASVRAKIFTDAEVTSNLAPTNSGSLGYEMAAALPVTATADEYVIQFPAGGAFLNPGAYWIVFHLTGGGNVHFDGDAAGTVNVKGFTGATWNPQGSVQNIYFKVLSCP